MGWVDVSPAPARGAALVAQGELDASELACVAATLRGVLAAAQQGGAAGVPGGLAARLAALKLGAAAAPAGPTGGQQQRQQQAPAPPAAQQQPAQAAPPAAQQQAPPAPAPAPAPVPVAPRSALVPVPQPMPVSFAAPAAPPPRQPQYAAQPPPPQPQPPQPQPPQPQQQYAPPPPPPPQQPPPQPQQPPPQQHYAPPPPAPAPPAAPAWVQVSASDAGDHGGNGVAALAWAPRLPGLPGGDGHMGWLITSSRGLLNLFECNAGGGARGLPSLMLMHAQAVDFLCSRLAVEPGLGLMFGASLATDRAAQECVSVHSLDPETLLAHRYRFAPPAQRGAAGAPSGRLINPVASLAPVGGALARCCAASYGGRVVVFEAPAAPPPAGSTITAARSSWDAHPGAAITSLLLSPEAPTLYSGANDGAIRAWDLRARPSAPAAVLAGHARNVTGLTVVHEGCLASCGIDGKVLLWDPRRPQSPYAAATPDGAPALRLAPSPFGDCLAVSTNRGLHAVDLIDGSASTQPIAPFPLPRPYSDIAWNAGTGELYAAMHSGAVAVFGRR